MTARLWTAAGSVVLSVFCATAFLGCPSVPDASLALIVSPKTLDFGTAETSLSFQVRKNYTRVPLGQFRVTSSADWISVSPETGTSTGPSDPATITVTIDRSQMGAGLNAGTVNVTAEGASRVQVSVQASRQLGAAFSVDNNAPFTGNKLQFTDHSTAVTDAPPINSWLWEFGDGTSSTERHPTHAYTSAGSYDVSLTVSNGDETATLTRQGYISVTAKRPPTANFTAAVVEALPGEEILFRNESAAGTSPITAFAWDFGDGQTSSAENPRHAYAEIGTYTVSLTVQTAHGQDTRTKQNYITIIPKGPEAAFSATPQEAVLGPAGASIEFQDESQPGTFPIAEWYWEFGDGATSTEPDPAHVYRDPGAYTVSLTVTDEHGLRDTSTVANFIQVIENTLNADFTVNRQDVDVGQLVQFTDTSHAGPAPITQWSWNFGDGSVSTQRNPSHTYSTDGVYTVSLTVTNRYGSDTEVKTDYITVAPASTLARYIQQAGPPSYSVHSSVPFPYQGQTITFTILDLKSQTFRPDEVSPGQWQHWMVLITPSNITTNTALMIISGGRNREAPPMSPENLSAEAQIAVEFAAQMGAAAILLPTVPNQPLVFHGDDVGRTEDNSIAYTFDQFLNTGDEFWPLLLPMTKSAVAAMDVAQEHGTILGVDIEDFVITGASKRGWTTWLSAVADRRVRAIAPLVIDVLNMQTQMDYHRQAYDGYSIAVQDYVDFEVFDRFNTERGQELLGIVDPYSYLESLSLPKLIINSTGDEFFLPDSAQFYVHDLPGETRLRYLPNTGHGVEQGDSLLDLAESLFSFFAVVAADAPLPSFSWEVTADNEIRVETDPAFPPSSVTLWTGTVSGEQRDFRYPVAGEVWSSEPLQQAGGGVYIATVPTPTQPNTWTGFFVDLVFEQGGISHTFSTELRVTPDEMPFSTAHIYEEQLEARKQQALEHYATGPAREAYAELARLETGRTPNESSFHAALDEMDDRIDCADFRVPAILRLLYWFADNPRVSSELLTRARDSVLDFKYWPDEPGIDSMCTWTENHQILFSAGAYLAGQLYPDEEFTNSGMTGTELMDVHRPRIMRWLDFRFRTGFSEWLSNVYYNEDLVALVSLVDLCADEEIALRAAMVTDLILLDIALNSHTGVFGSTHGRSSEHRRKWAETESTADVTWMMFGLGAPRSSSRSAVCLAMSPNYQMPEVIYSIANDLNRPHMINRQRMGIKLEEAERWGLSFDNFEDGMVWLSMEAYAHPLTLPLFVEMLYEYNWWENDFFAPFAIYRDLIEDARATGTLPQLAEAYEHDITRNIRDEVNIYTYRTPDYMLSTAQDYRVGYGGDQHAIWQATLGPNAVCFTTHPAQYEGETPNYWTGEGWLPRVAQHENVAIIVYNAEDKPGLYYPQTLDFTHAWLPQDQFDEFVEEGGWFFARTGDGYLAFRSQHPYTWQTQPGEDQNRELIVPGRQNIYICEMGRQSQYGSFADFRQAIVAADLEFGPLQVAYDSPSQGLLEFGWTGDLTLTGATVNLGEYPRYGNPYVYAAFPSETITVSHLTNRLELEWETPKREVR